MANAKICPTLAGFSLNSDTYQVIVGLCECMLACCVCVCACACMRVTESVCVCMTECMCNYI